MRESAPLDNQLGGHGRGCGEKPAANVHTHPRWFVRGQANAVVGAAIVRIREMAGRFVVLNRLRNFDAGDVGPEQKGQIAFDVDAVRALQIRNLVPID